jgi:hypothetical protein
VSVFSHSLVLRALANHPSLLELHLCNNEIYGDGLPRILLRTWAMFTNLQTLNLYQCGISLQGMHSLIRCVDNDQWTNLQNLYFSDVKRRCICCQRDEDKDRVAQEDATIPEVTQRLHAILRRNREIKAWRDACPFYYFVLKESVTLLFEANLEYSASIEAYQFPSELYLYMLEYFQDY